MSKTTFAERDKKFEPAKTISYQLLDVEMLYLLNHEPRKIEELRTVLNYVFDIAPEVPTIFIRIRTLEKNGLVLALDSQSKNTSYTITPAGLLILNRCIESISQIALTMQLGLNQKLVRA